MSNNALIVFTAKTVETILYHGGTQSWVLSPTSMRDVRYVVCTRNSDRAYDEECGPRTEAHGEAFLVGKVSGLLKVDERNGRKRYLVQISEYALVSEKDFWTHDRNPTRYTDTSALHERGIDVDSLDWRPMPEVEEDIPMPDATPPATMRDGLTIAEAKHGLSVKFGVPEEAILITING
ncbi:MAG: hypothetical protein B7X90_14625 [Novosphingobium sp. 17-62-19]|uniref:hypothetical protein n=1 Tax=Novosphingobium sp. 17-62-19 TaxID=1970406 RepID=UPI000BC6716C|nr:hypothetical protein [Novosphingobium sp. 17-62-19]OZA17531.1 MAG: hypothetical protein B7X90_14625 [Novosphingobium sp. 17-62-19]HQS96824.1 hypothetical protein [Novosphingobium sp.]